MIKLIQHRLPIQQRDLPRMTILFSLLFLLATVMGSAQILEPVSWTSRIEKNAGGNAVVIFEGTIEKGWHMYSQYTPEGGPLAMEIAFKNQEGNYRLIGKAKEGPTRTAYNNVFGVNETFFEMKAHIEQQIQIINPDLRTVEAAFDFQVCKEACINSSKKFSIAVPSDFKTSAVGAMPATGITKTAADRTRSEGIGKEQQSGGPAADTAAPGQDHALPATGRSLWSIFLVAFISGFAALLTPCVFPMIPLTVSFFTKQSKSRAGGIRNVIFYGISIIAIYVMLGLAVTKIFGADALNALSTDVWFNLIFFAILVVFAASFLGAFEILLPASWANRADRQVDKGGVTGILFMALVLAIVSFSCTGPIVGTLLVEAASNGGIAPVIGMLGFSSALALPFMLFALFPGWLTSLPKSGGWLNTVKVVLGFLELALAFKFLSNADLVLQLHLLEREIFIAIWIAIFAALTLYLFGKITLPHDGPLPHISVGRLSLGLLTLSFTVYLIPGLWGAPLKLIGAFPPPTTYSESPLGIGAANPDGIGAPLRKLPKGAQLGPHGIMAFHDYEDGLAYAREIKKPILLDFTGHACVNCRKMENNVWSDPKVLSILKDDVVLISLYVDDKRDLPEGEQYVTPGGSEIRTVGDKWTDFMISKYRTNTQPLYVLTDLEGNNLNGLKPTISYVGSEEYRQWLTEGIAGFR